MKDVPLIRSLPRHEQIEMYSKVQHKEYKDREYIVRQGDAGDAFYIILEGSANVVDENLGVSEYEGRMIGDGVLATLREGHVFGEMALLTDEPRVASVIAIERTVCLCLSKADFRAALSAEVFNSVVVSMMKQRQVTRVKRNMSRVSSMQSSGGGSSSRRMSRTYSSDALEESRFPELDAL